MTKIREFYQRHQVLVPFLIIAVVTGLGFARLQSDAKLRREQICKAEIEDRVLFEDILKFSAESQATSQVDLSSLPPELQELIEQSQANSEVFYASANAKLDIPPEICNNTGITEAQIRQEQQIEAQND